jgi:anti-sigma B factor antagonist
VIHEGTFTVEVERTGEILRVSLAGELDIAVEQELVARVREAIAETDARSVVLDVATVSFIDSSGLRALLMCRDAAQARGLALVLAVPDGPVRRLLDVAGVAAWFDYE